MTTESGQELESAPEAAADLSTPTDLPPPEPRITPSPESGERLPQMIERTRRRGRRRRAPIFTPQEVAEIDYKNVDSLRKLISDRGRIEPRRKTGLTAKDQRKMAREIKRARQVALLPYTAEHMRQTSRFRTVTRLAQRAMQAEMDDAPPSEPAEGGAVSEMGEMSEAPFAEAGAVADLTDLEAVEAPEASAEIEVEDAPVAEAEELVEAAETKEAPAEDASDEAASDAADEAADEESDD